MKPKQTMVLTGSREAVHPELYRVARAMTAYLIRNEWDLVVGDADGIDRTIIQESDVRSNPNLTVYGWGGEVRRPTHYGQNVITNGRPKARNTMMIAKGTACFAFWNGTSRGTVDTFTKAIAAGLPTTIVRTVYESKRRPALNLRIPFMRLSQKDLGEMNSQNTNQRGNNFVVGTRYAMTEQDATNLAGYIGIGAILIGRLDWKRGRVFDGNAGSWHCWNMNGQRVHIDIDPSIPSVIASVEKDVDPERPDPL